MRLQQLTPANSAGLTLGVALQDFMLHQRTSRHSPRTIQYYEFSLGRFLSWNAKEQRELVGDVTSGTIRQFMLDLESTMKPNSVHAFMRAVRAFFIFLEREEMLDSNPMRKVRMPKTDKTILEAFTTDEVSKLLKATEGKDVLDVRNRALLLLLLDSGLRLCECSELKVGDIDLATGTMKVMGKGRKERMSKLGGVALKAFVKYARLRGGKDGEPLWLGRRGAMTHFGISETLEKIGKRVGVHTHPHKFRRTCALTMLRNGADVFSVQYLLGHADLGVLRRYLAQTDSDVVKAHEKFSAADSLA